MTHFCPRYLTFVESLVRMATEIRSHVRPPSKYLMFAFFSVAHEREKYTPIPSFEPSDTRKVSMTPTCPFTLP